MDNLEIRALSAVTRIGVHAWEQRIGQKLLLDISIPTDVSQTTDELEQTIDYAVLCQEITTYVESNAFKLIETVANGVAELILRDERINRVTVSVSKPHAVKNAGDVRITVQRLQKENV